MRRLSFLFIVSLFTCLFTKAEVLIDGVYYTKSTHFGVSGYDLTQIDKGYAKTVEELVIPEEITVNGEKYPVIGIQSILTKGIISCKVLKKLVVPKTIIYLGPNAIINGHITELEFNCKNLSSDNHSVNVQYVSCANVKEPIYSDTFFFFMPRDYKGSYSIPEGIKKVGNDAFTECYGITKLTLPSTLEEVGYGGFFGNMEELDLPESLNVIPDYLIFNYNCVKKTIANSKFIVAVPRDYEGEYVVPEGVEYIKSFAFGDCKNLTSIKLPSTLKEIGGYAFQNCTNLTSITLPESLDYIGGQAFEGCGIKQISIPSQVRLFHDTTVPIVCWGISDGVEVTLNWTGKPPFIYGSHNPQEQEPYSGPEYYSTVYIPYGTLDTYKSLYGFNSFVNVVELAPTAIDHITVNPTRNAIYDLNGQRLTSPRRGINIVDGKKVLIK